MALQTERKSIDGLEVTTTQLPSMRALALSTRLLKVVAPAMAHAGGLSMASDIADLAPALAALAGQLEPELVQSLTRELLAFTTVEMSGKVMQLSTEEAINLAFAGRLMTLFKVLAFSLKVNFENFFDAARAAAAQFRPAAEEHPST